jgi:hypothetical protein
MNSLQHLIANYLLFIPGGDTLTVIGNALHSRFRDSQPKLHDLYWFPGQLCIAQYHADKKWYRGKVVEVSIKLNICLKSC